MTIVASPRQAHLFHGLRMTLGTLQAFMLSCKREISQFVMVKPPVFPAACAVAGFTLDTQTTPVLVFLSVTGNTCDRGVLECFSTVTVLTLRFYMAPQ